MSSSDGHYQDDVDAKAFNRIMEKIGMGSSNTSARSPTSKDDSKYKMNHTKRGIAIIFNQEDFKDKLPTRTGTNRDQKALVETLTALRFEVRKFHNSTMKEIKNNLQNMSSLDHNDADCVLIAILSHGELNAVYSSDGILIQLEELYEHFTPDRCPGLAGKPKIFVVQACQGVLTDCGYKVVRQEGRTGKDSGSSEQSYRIPNRADFITVFSTVPGYVAWRNEDGSWFIQSLTKILNQHAFKLDFLTMMTHVSREVAEEFSSHNPKDPNYHGKKQVPYVMSTLTREIRF